MTIREALNFGLARKTKLISETTRRGYENKIKNIIKWLDTDRPDLVYITKLDKKMFITFLNGVLDRTSVRNNNNFRTDLSSIVQVFVDNDIIGQNFIKKYPRSKPFQKGTRPTPGIPKEKYSPILKRRIPYDFFKLNSYPLISCVI